jgi:hypothetical protein
MKTICAVLLLACAPFAFAFSFRPDPSYERVLIPVFISGPGAQGAQWETAVTITSTAEERFRLARPALLYYQDRFCDLSCAERWLVPRAAAGVSRYLEHPAGLMLWVPRSFDRDNLYASIRVHDAARNTSSAGTSVPLVREDDLTAGRMMLLDVPVRAGFRTSLRLYDLYHAESEFEVRIYDFEAYREGGAEPLIETIVKATSAEASENVQYQQRPAFAFIGDLVDAYPQLAGLESVVIEIWGLHPLVSPPAYDKRFYALASVTNDATNEVTIIAPR